MDVIRKTVELRYREPQGTNYLVRYIRIAKKYLVRKVYNFLQNIVTASKLGNKRGSNKHNINIYEQDKNIENKLNNNRYSTFLSSNGLVPITKHC